MYRFLWTGTDRNGNKRSTFVNAENAASARESLTHEGWTNLEMVQDEIGSSAAAWVSAPPDIEREVTAEMLVAAHEGKQSSGAALWLQSIWESKGTVLLGIGVLVLGIYQHRTWTIVIGSVCVALSLLIVPLAKLFFGLPMRAYNALNQAKVWARWQEVLLCVERLRRAGGITKIAVGEVELARCRAQALAGLGRLDVGLGEFTRVAEANHVERWLQLSHTAGILDVAKEFEKSLELRKQAAAEKPDSAATWIDVAYGCVRGLNRPAEAREALNRAQTLELPPLAKHYIPFLTGVILWRESQFAAARPEIEKALAGFQSVPQQNPLLFGLQLLVKSYLAAIHAALGNAAEAQRLFAETEKYLIAHKETELLAAIRGQRAAA